MAEQTKTLQLLEEGSGGLATSQAQQEHTSSQGSIQPQPLQDKLTASTITHGNHYSLTTVQERLRASSFHQPSAQPQPQDSCSTKQESMNCIKSVLQKLMASSPSVGAEVEGRGKRKEMEISKVHREELWPNTAVDALLTKFEYLCFNQAQGQLGKTHWGRIAAAVNAACGANYTAIQCKYKWNRLKKSYSKAKLHSEPSRFSFYDHVERIVEKASKSAGRKQHPLQNEVAEDDDGDGDGDDDAVDSTCEAASNESKQDEPPIQMEDRYPKRRGVSLKSFGHKMERTMTHLAHTMENIEKTRTDEIKKLLDAQFQISTVLAQGKKEIKQSGVTGSSAREIRRTGLVCQQEGPNGRFVPPLNFAMVDKGVYRSGFPNNTNLPFLETLKLRSIICLCSKRYPEVHMEFLQAHKIQVFHVGIERYKEPILEIPEDIIREALKLLLDKRNRPVLIHCKRGKRRTSCLVGCFRKVQNWCLASVFDEYQRFAGIKSQVLDLQFIEQFNAPNM